MRSVGPHEAPQRARDQHALARQRAEPEVLVEHAGVDLVRRRGRARRAASGCARPPRSAPAQMSRYFSARGNVSRDSTSSSRSRVLVSAGKASAPRSTGSPAGRRGLALRGRQQDQQLRSVWTSAAVLGPARVEGALLVHAPVGVGAEEVALALDQVRRAALAPVAVVVGERGRERRHRDALLDGARRSPCARRPGRRRRRRGSTAPSAGSRGRACSA